MSHIICPHCLGRKRVLDPDGVSYLCGNCAASGVVNQSTGHPDGWVANAVPEPLPVADVPADDVGGLYVGPAMASLLEPPPVPVGTEPVGSTEPPPE